MPKVTVICDRCGKTIEGLHIPATEESPIGGTSGYYNVTNPTWGKYANEGEKVVCDSCMWADPRYQKDYPPITFDTNSSA